MNKVMIEYFVIFLRLAQNRFVCIYIFICESQVNDGK